VGTIPGGFHHSVNGRPGHGEQLAPSVFGEALTIQLAKLSSLGNQILIVAAKYFPLGRPATFQTWINSLRVSYPYVALLGARLTGLAGPLRFLATVTARLALALDQPVVATR